MEDDLSKFLADLTLAATKSLTSSLKEAISKRWRKLEYGVTLSVEEANSLKKIAENNFYLLFKKYLNAHWSLKLIKVGIYISELNDEGKIKRVNELNVEVYRKYGLKGKRIIQLASTGILIPLMNHIIDIKLTKGANPFVLHQEFDKILEEWEKIAIPVGSIATDADIKKQVLIKMDNANPIFFLYAAGIASKHAQLSLAKMNNENLFQNKYLMTPQKPKIVNEIEYCLWTFEKVDNSQESIISQQLKK